MQNDDLPEKLPTCLWARPTSPPCVYFLADHLDAVLAAGEDMRTIRITWGSAAGSTLEDTVRDLDSLREGVEDLRSLELTLIARLLKSRERAEELTRADARLKLAAKLFLSGTAIVADALSEFSDAIGADFNTGDACLAYLRARELLAADAAAPSDGARLRITDAFPVARRLPLGTLLDLVAQFLDTMELHHDIYIDQGTRVGSSQPEETEKAMSSNKEEAAPAATAPSTATDAGDAARASTPPRRGFRSLTAALAELEEQERAKQAAS